MRSLFTVLALTLFVTAACAQSSNTEEPVFTRLNSVQLEAGGHAGYYSLNYERILTNAPKFKTSVQAGFAYYPAWTGLIEFWIPVALNGIYSIGNGYHVELGLGHSFTNEKLYYTLQSERIWGGFLTSRVGVRYQLPNSRLLARAGGVLFLSYPSSPQQRVVDVGYEFHLLPGVALGYCF